jgi:hypothetical protein
LKVKVHWINSCLDDIVLGPPSRGMKATSLQGEVQRRMVGMCNIDEVNNGRTTGNFRNMFILDSIETLSPSEMKAFMAGVVRNKARKTWGPVVITTTRPFPAPLPRHSSCPFSLGQSSLRH